MHRLLFGYKNGNSEVQWDTRDIWDAVKDLPTIHLPTSLFKETAKNVFLEYGRSDINRTKKADLSYPIIIPRSAVLTGSMIIDGYHRLYRHLEQHIPEIPVKVLDKMPRPIFCKGTPFTIDGLEFDWYDPWAK